MEQMMRARRGGLRATAAVAATAMTAAMVAATSAPAAADHVVVDRGAYGVASTGLLNVGPVANCAVTTVLGECQNEVASLSQVGLTAGVIRVRTTGTHDPARADSEATIAEAAFAAGGQAVFSAQTIKSSCVADATGLTGASVLADADIVGVETPAPFDAANPPPNTVAVNTPLLRIVLNEQIISADRSQINVNAVHITVLAPVTGAVVQEVVLASTQCSYRAVAVPPPPPAPEPEPEPEEVRGAVNMTDKCGRAGDAFRAKRVRGVTYRVSGNVIREGVWLRARTRTVRVRAVATNERYEVVGRNVFTLRFTNRACPRPPEVLPATGV